MRIDGVVVEVMESMPLQLVVKSGSSRIFVGLQADTTIKQKASWVDPGVLQPGMHVRIDGAETMQDAMTADSIEIRN